jgi:glucokinase
VTPSHDARDSISPTELVVADIGGTHARFAIASLDGAQVIGLSKAWTIKTADHAGLPSAWEAFGRELGQPLPRAVAIAVAGTVGGEVLRLTNTAWTFRPAELPQALSVDAVTLVNDFAAVAHSLAHLPASDLTHLCGPDVDFPAEGVISVIGPGTGLGVALLVRQGGLGTVVATEGSHIDFAPLDATDDAILAGLRAKHGRVSVERIVSGPGLACIYQALATLEGRAVVPFDDAALWRAALLGEDDLAAAALDRFCLNLGAVAGDLALAQGAVGVVLAGGVGLRLADRLPKSGFAKRFVAKGRFEAMMAAMPVKLLTHPQPGLYGAAAAFAAEHRR